MKDINLLQVSKTEKKLSAQKQYKRGAAIALLLTVSLLGLGYVGMRVADYYYTTKTEALRQEAPSYAKVTEVKSSIATRKTLADNYTLMLKTASATSYVDTSFLFSLRSVLNDNIFFKNLALAENGTLLITGTAATRLDITYFAYNLKKTGLFLDVNLSVVNTDMKDQKSVKAYEFTLNAILKGGVLGA